MTFQYYYRVSFPIFSATESSPNVADERVEDADVKTETISSATTVDVSDNSKDKNEEEETRNAATAIATVVNSSIEENMTKKRNDLNDRIHNDSYEEGSRNSFGTNSGKLLSFEDTAVASPIEMSRMLEHNLKRPTTDDRRTASFNKRLKSLRKTKLQVNFESLIALHKLLLLSCFRI